MVTIRTLDDRPSAIGGFVRQPDTCAHDFGPLKRDPFTGLLVRTCKLCGRERVRLAKPQTREKMEK
jgi:hypothetical protein